MVGIGQTDTQPRKSSTIYEETAHCQLTIVRFPHIQLPPGGGSSDTAEETEMIIISIALRWKEWSLILSIAF